MLSQIVLRSIKEQTFSIFSYWLARNISVDDFYVHSFNGQPLGPPGRNSVRPGDPRCQFCGFFYLCSILPFASLCEGQTQGSYITTMENDLLKQTESNLGITKWDLKHE
jgi:hypothetical protein